MADMFAPNYNQNLVVLNVWHHRNQGLEDTAEFPIIGWRFCNGDDYWKPVCAGEFEPARHEAAWFMVFDRAIGMGYHAGGQTYGRDCCVKALKAEVEHYRARKGAK